MAATEIGILLTFMVTAHDYVWSVWKLGSGSDAKDDLT